jgi:glycerol uptake facilitator-like aquaporin
MGYAKQMPTDNKPTSAGRFRRDFDKISAAMRMNRIALPVLLPLLVASLSGQTGVADKPAFSVAPEDLEKAFPAKQPGRIR